MLALKELHFPARQTIHRHLLDLPDELLDEVIHHAHADNRHSTRDIVPSSLTCWRLRKAVAPLLFHTLQIRLTNRYVDRRTFNILLSLDSSPQSFARHVRHLKQDDSFCFRASGCEDLALSNELVKGLAIQGLQCLTSLRTIRYDPQVCV